MGTKKGYQRILLVLTLVLALLCGGCQSAVVKDVQAETERTREQMSGQTEQTSGAEQTETRSGEMEGKETEEPSPAYIDADYVEAHYSDADEDDLSRYKTGGTEESETQTVAGSSRAAKEQGTNEEQDTSHSDTVTGMKEEETSDSIRNGQNGDDWDGNWDDWIAQQDQYKTDPVPEGKPDPVEPQDEVVDTSTSLTCTLYVECSTILNNMGDLTEGKEDLVPSDGVIYGPYTVTFYQGESVYDLLLREMQGNRIHMEAEFTPMYNSAYVQGINNLYEKDCGSLSGWMYCVNGWFPNYGCSRYQLEQGDVVEWHYTCDLGRDLGRDVSE